MQRKNVKMLLDVYDNRRDTKVFNAVRKNDQKRLAYLLNKNAEVNSMENGMTALQLAAELEHWDCVKMLARRSHYGSSWGMVLIKAAKENRLDVVKALCHNRDIFLKNNKLFSKFWRDTEGNTALHYAVENNNPEMCSRLISKYCLLRGNRHPKLCMIKNKEKLTPFELAVSLDHLECTKVMAKYIDLKYLLQEANPNIPFVYKLAFNDIIFSYFGDRKREVPLSYKFYHWITPHRKQLVLDYVLTLSNEEKIATFEQALNPSSPLSLLFNNKKIKEQISIELKKIKQFLDEEGKQPAQSNRHKTLVEKSPAEEKMTDKRRVITPIVDSLSSPNSLNKHSIFSESRMRPSLSPMPKGVFQNAKFAF